MSEKLTEYQNELIKSIAENQIFDNYEVEVTHGPTKKDGFLGIITTVCIKSDTKKLDVIIKSAETNENVRKQFPIKEVYLREIYVYEEVFSYFDKFQKENGLLDGFNSFAKLYGSCKEDNRECLVLENLKDTGYKMLDKRAPMDELHVTLVISEYAKFHAVSLAMREKEPNVYRKLTEHLKDIFDMKADMILNLKSMIENDIHATTDDYLTKALKRSSDYIERFVMEDLRYSKDQLVLTHVDGWSNNIMFKYEDPYDIRKPTKVCLIDWQLSKIGSPVLDLAFFFFVNSSQEVLSDYQKYLKMYHDAVTLHLRKLSCDPNIFPFCLLEQHWKKYAKFGLYNAIIYIKLMLGESDDVIDLCELAESGKKLSDRLNFKLDSSRRSDYQKRILDIVHIMAENELI